jgi:hypothetical protein
MTSDVIVHSYFSTSTLHSLTFKSTSTSSTDRARGFLTSSGLLEPFEYTLMVSLGITFRYLHDRARHRSNSDW